MAQPTEYTIKAITEQDGRKRVILDGWNGELGVSPGSALEGKQQGDKLRGWLNQEGKWGPYFKVADDQTQMASNGGQQAAQGGRDDAVGRSIERQVAAKCAAEVLAPHYPQIPDAQFAGEVGRVVDAFAAAIAKSDQDIPF